MSRKVLASLSTEEVAPCVQSQDHSYHFELFFAYISRYLGASPLSTSLNPEQIHALLNHIHRSPTDNSFVHLLPDPACLLDDMGRLGPLNSAFEQLLLSTLPASSAHTQSSAHGSSPLFSIKDLIDPVSFSLLKVAMKQAQQSTTVIIQQIVIPQDDQHVWTLSSKGLPNQHDSGDGFSFLFIYSRYDTLKLDPVPSLVCICM